MAAPSQMKMRKKKLMTMEVKAMIMVLARITFELHSQSCLSVN